MLWSLSRTGGVIPLLLKALFANLPQQALSSHVPTQRFVGTLWICFWDSSPVSLLLKAKAKNVICVCPLQGRLNLCQGNGDMSGWL